MGRPRCDVVMRPGEFGLRDDAQNGCHTLSLVGELDLVTAPELQATINSLCKAGAREIVLDLHELAFIDSTGLQVILTASQVCERHGCDFSLTRVQPPSDFVEAAQLRVWLCADLVRVELRVPSELLSVSPQRSGPDYDRIVLDQIADRWSIDTDQDVVWVWFEIDRARAHRDIQRR